MDFNISQSNKHNINLICLYILDIILFLAILYIYKCTEIKLGHLRKGMSRSNLSNREMERMEKGLNIKLTEPKMFEALPKLEAPIFDVTKFDEL